MATNGPNHEKLLKEVVEDLNATPAPGTTALEPQELAARLGDDFEILELHGRGGMGAVYKAVQRKLDRVVALKVLPEELAKEPGFTARFEQEARTLASLNHPHILTVHDFGETDGLCYLVTEFVDGVDLQKLLELGQLSPAEALRITPQICQALQYAHERGVVHRDIKPANILIDVDGQVKIADFGLARLTQAETGLTRSTQVMGTPQYMAPEQWRGMAVDHRADIFSLGVVIYEMLTGQLPVGHFDPVSRQAGVPRGLDDVVRRTLAQQPENRYQSVREVETDVSRQASSRPAPVPGKPQRTSGTKVLVVVLLLVLGLPFLLAAGGSLLYLSVAQDPVAQSQEVYPADTLGWSVDRLVEVLGPPLDANFTSTQMTWHYRTEDGEVCEDAVTIANDRVVSYAKTSLRLVPTEKAAVGPHAGQRFESVVRLLGPPDDKIVGNSPVVQYEYASGLKLYVAFGRVVAVRRN